MLNYFKSRDIFILRIFNNSMRCTALDFIMPLITYLGSTQFCLSFCILALLYPNLTINRMGMYSFLVLLTSTALVQLLKRRIIRIRPFEIVENLNVRKIQIDRFSFPSGHTAAAFSIMLSLVKFFPLLWPLWLCIAILVGISRMYLGVHYPSDVLVASAIGALCAFAVNLAIF